MKKTLIFAVLAAVIAGVVVLGIVNNSITNIVVDYGTDIPKKYRDFFEYTFGDYKVKLEEKTIHYQSDIENYGSQQWNLSYFDKNNNLRTGRIWCSKFTDYDRKEFESENSYNYSLIYDFCEKQTTDIACEEFTDNILKNYFETAYYSDSDGLSDYDDFYGDKGYELRFFTDIREMENPISSTHGIRLSAIDLKNIGSSEDIEVYFSIIIDRDENQQEYIEKLDSIFEDYCEYVGTPNNYLFDVVLNIDKEHKEYEKIYSLNDKKEG